MLSIKVTVPPPSQFNKDEVIDSIATAYNQAYREHSDNKQGYPVDMEYLIDLFEIAMLYESIEEPDGAIFLARYTPAPEERITINQQHADLFEERPYVYASALGHEVGHRALRHSDLSKAGTSTPSLFGDEKPTTQHFHKSSWGQFGMTKEEVVQRKALVQQIAKQAVVNEQARQVITQLQRFYEPEWMFWQAEHFSRCLLIPKDRLLEQLENSWDLSRWSSIYRLAEIFGVSGSIMRRRLEKLGIIKIVDDGQPHSIQRPKQADLFKSS